MKKLFYFIIFLASTNLLATNYSLIYTGIKVGQIENINTLNDKYVDIDVTNGLAKMLLGKNKLTFYEEGTIKDLNLTDRKYKKDRHSIIKLLGKAINNKIIEETIEFDKDKKIEIKKENEAKFIYKYYRKNELKSFGELSFKENNFVSLEDKKNNLTIIKEK